MGESVRINRVVKPTTAMIPRISGMIFHFTVFFDTTSKATNPIKNSIENPT